MPITLTLLAALAAGNWHCEQSNGLWECREPSAPAPSAAASAATEPSSQSTGQSGPAPAVAAPRVTESEPLPATGPEPSSIPQPAPALSTGEEAAPALLPDAVEEAYVVQVGAFRSEAVARQEAKRLADERLVMMPIRRDGEDWFVLVLGAYSTWEEADAVGRAYEENSGGSFWVRNASDLQRIMRRDQAP